MLPVRLSIESFIGKLADELLDAENLNPLQVAQVIIERWHREYNTCRPHSSLGYRPPAPETVQWPPWEGDRNLLVSLI